MENAFITDIVIKEMKKRCEDYLKASEEGLSYYVRRDELKSVIALAKVLGEMTEVAVFEINREPEVGASDPRCAITD